MPVVYQPDFIK